MTVVAAPSAARPLAAGTATDSLYSPGETLRIVNVPSGPIFVPAMPNDDDDPGPLNSCIMLTDSPASGVPDADTAVPEIVPTRPGTIAKSGTMTS